MKQYPILVEQGSNETAWGIIVPDMPGCFSAADDEQDIVRNAREAIVLYLEGVSELPEPTSLAKLLVQKKNKKFAVLLVDVDVSAFESPKRRINIVLPDTLIQRIDAATDNRSGFLAEAAREKLAHAAQ